MTVSGWTIGWSENNPPRVVPVETHPPVGADLSALLIWSRWRSAFTTSGASLLPGFHDRLLSPTILGWLIGFLPGPREWLLVALVVAALYGRSETARRGFARVVRPWKTPPSGAKRAAQSSWQVDRWFVLAAVVASAAVASWVVTWMTVVHRPPAP